MNYVCLTVLLFFYAIIARPQILFVLALSICAGAYLVGIRQEPLELNGALVSDARVLQVITAGLLPLRTQSCNIKHPQAHTDTQSHSPSLSLALTLTHTHTLSLSSPVSLCHTQPHSL